MARKCGTCQRNTIDEQRQRLRVNLAATAHQPMTGGIAPGTAPISVLSVVMRFSGV